MNIDLGITLNPLFIMFKPIVHFFLPCHHFIQSRQTHLDTVQKIVNDISNFTNDALVNFLLYGSQYFNVEENSTIIKASIKDILSRETFSGSLI